MKKKIMIALCTIAVGIYILGQLYTKEAVEVEQDICQLVYEPDMELMELFITENQKYDELAWNERKQNYLKLYPELYVEPVKPAVELTNRRVAYLSFDDGPSRITPQILDALKEYRVPATFFIIAGTVNEDGKEMLKRMVDEGHTIGIHTYSHNKEDIYSSVESYLKDFNKVYLLIYEVTGVKTNIFRFPWGSSNVYNQRIKKELQEEMTRRGFAFYDWNVSAEDSYGMTSADVIKNNIVKDLDKFQSPIILMHDSAINGNTAKVLPDVLKVMVDKGFHFSTLERREPYYFK